MFSIKAPVKKLSSIYGVIQPLYIGARLFGFFPCTVKIENGKKRIYFTFIDFIVILTQITIYSCFAYINIAYNLMANSVVSPLLLIGMRIGLIFGLLNIIVWILADLYNRYEISNIFDMYQDFDMQMQLLGSTLNYKQTKQCIYKYFAVWTTISLLYNFISIWLCIEQYNLDVLALTFSGFFLATNAFGILLSTYSFFLFSIRARYALLNKTLSQLLTKAKASQAITASTKLLIGNLMKLADLHDTLNVILDNVNRCYAMQVMLAFGSSFIYMVFSLFSVYRGWIMSTVDEYKQFNLSIVLILWASYYSFFLVTVIYAGHSTKYEGKFTGVLIHRAINRSYDAEVVERLLTFSQQMKHKIPDANCNLFSFDWTLMYSIVAATATYLIILIQFDASGYEPLSNGTKHSSLSH